MSKLSSKDSCKARALEFFSGIGAFAQAACESEIEVVGAFDQKEEANATYYLNYGLRPKARNLDSISLDEIPEADIWWMSPPCTPFSVRGKQKDDGDPRAASFLNLIRHVPRLLPGAILVENVLGFVGSRVHKFFLATLTDCGYTTTELDLCPTAFGVPMRRPRHFVVAVRDDRQLVQVELLQKPPVLLANFLEPESDPALTVEEEILERYGQGFDIVNPSAPDAYLTCFTSGYWRCRKASGSLLALPDGGARRVSPAEILRLLGFGPDYVFPDRLDLPARWRLVGNSVDVRAVRHLLAVAGYGHE